MANGNMGDLSMTLTLQSRVEDETRKIIQELNKVDASGKRAQEALNLIKEAASGIKGAEGSRVLVLPSPNYPKRLAIFQATRRFCHRWIL